MMLNSKKRKRRNIESIKREIKYNLSSGEGINKSLANKISELDFAEFLELLPITNSQREKVFGRKVHLCAIINAKSGRCTEDCCFCAQSRRYKTRISEYPLLEPEEIVLSAMRAKKFKATEFSIVCSGRKVNKKEEIEKVSTAIAKIKELGLEACASLGMVSLETLLNLKSSGLIRYHHNLESARSFFPNVSRTHSYEEKINTIKRAKSAGLKVCSGGIFGLGESWENRIELAYELKALDVDSVPINFLVPIAGTPMESRDRLSPLEALKIIVIYRLILPTKRIIICGGREVVLGDFQSFIFFAGATGMIVGNYLTTKGRRPEEDLKLIEELNLEPVYELGS